MRKGMYANRTIYVDIENGTKDIVDFNIGDFDLKSGRVLACTKAIERELRNELKKAKPLNGHQFGATELDSIGS